MAALKDVLAYLLLHYPRNSDLSDARVTKMVYLADWKHSIEEKGQITDIQWRYNHYGPYVKNVIEEVKANTEIFSCRVTTNIHGSPKKLLTCSDESYSPMISEAEKQSLDHVINSTGELNWDQFIKLVYSTWPVVSHDQYDEMDLVKAAEEYRETEYFLTYQTAKERSRTPVAAAG